MRSRAPKDRTESRGISPLLLIFLTVFIDLVGFGILLPVLAIDVRILANNNETVVGVLMASYSAMQFIFVPILGRLSDRVGRRPVLLLSVIGTSLSFLLMGYALLPAILSLPLLFVARILDGISGANISAAQAYIADVTPPEKRARGMGIIGAAFGLGFIFGPVIGGILSQSYGMAAPAFAAAALSAVNALGIFFILPESLKEKGQHQTETGRSLGTLQRFTNRPQIMLPIFVFFLSQIAASITQFAFPLFMSDPQLHWHLDVKHISYLFAYIGIVVAIIQGGLIGRMVKKGGEVRVALMGIVVLAISYFVFPHIMSWAGLYLALAGMALGQGSIIPALNGLVSRRSGAEEQGLVLGVNQSMASLARVLGPLGAGWVYHSFSPFGTYYMAAGFLVLALLASLGFGRS